MSKTIWIARDVAYGAQYSVVRFKKHLSRNSNPEGDMCWECDAEAGTDTFCAVAFEALTGLKLKPGEGPVKVKLTMERA